MLNNKTGIEMRLFKKKTTHKTVNLKKNVLNKFGNNE